MATPGDNDYFVVQLHWHAPIAGQSEGFLENLYMHPAARENYHMEKRILFTHADPSFDRFCSQSHTLDSKMVYNDRVRRQGILGVLEKHSKAMPFFRLADHSVITVAQSSALEIATLAIH
ncbi:hypothetical protein [Pseudomonas helleri]|uniref:hypothetical protein n=1 Tax=Pseudomonas helleri TaxID=1608996 RepID=UPI00334096AB